MLGGYHIQAENVAGLDFGRKVAIYVFPKTKAHFEGTAEGSADRQANCDEEVNSEPPGS